jgi:hypothetical protein
MMFPVQLAFSLLACSGTSPQSAADIPYEDTTVQAALDALQKAEAVAAEPTSLKSLESRMVQVELTISRMENGGFITAENVGYDPRATRLSGRKVQDAMDELEKRVREVESRVREGLGNAGPGLFEIPMDEPGMGGPSDSMRHGGSEGQGEHSGPGGKGGRNDPSHHGGAEGQGQGDGGMPSKGGGR